MLTTVRAVASAAFDSMTAPMATMMLLAMLQMMYPGRNQRIMPMIRSLLP